jgi:tripartite-type tricarboxylate transporter receptor subunit TctC
MDRPRFIIGSAAAASALAGRTAFAQDAYPTHAITFVNPFPPGGVADVIGRPLAAALEPVLKRPSVVERPSARSAACRDEVARRAS